ncbi:hypothetical protein I4F81_002497 [Pyropia yezoensis]|uniref:Uncharacterized protein n=1 Tax=Pyropia yezoensis TaxID=2788 RepID=A0ACC3BPJ1_PYRYE|nr:hypothetical protein I4F81_002497 [Neopyropia yezoensis]
MSPSERRVVAAWPPGKSLSSHWATHALCTPRPTTQALTHPALPPKRFRPPLLRPTPLWRPAPLDDRPRSLRTMDAPAAEASADTLFDMAEVAKHATARDCWLVISGGVYDVTSYLSEHPGGEDVMLDMAGKDATNEFDDVGHSADAVEQLRHLRIGSVLATAAPTGPAGGTAAGAATASAPAAGWAAVPAVAGTDGSAVADPVAAAAAAGKDGAAAAASAAAAAAANGGKAAVGSGAVAKGGVAPSRAGDAMRALAATLAALAAVTAVMAARRYVATLYWQRKG